MFEVVETKTKEYFQETMAELMNKQNARRDLMLEALLKGQAEKAKSYLDQVQLYGTGIQACQQSIDRIEKYEENQQKKSLSPPKAKGEGA